MPGRHVVVRFPSEGTIVGDAMRRHPEARLTSVPGRRDRGVVEHLALVEGLDDRAIAEMLLAWNRRYGMPADVIGDSFALRLPVRVEALPGPMAALVRMGAELPVLGNVATHDWAEQWIRCRSPGEAEVLAGRIRQALAASPEVDVRVADPVQHDADCWEVLHFAAGAPLEHSAVEAA